MKGHFGERPKMEKLKLGLFEHLKDTQFSELRDLKFSQLSSPILQRKPLGETDLSKVTQLVNGRTLYGKVFKMLLYTIQIITPAGGIFVC